jgi:hypothetical protein
MAVATPRWAQVQLTLPPAKRGCHLITQRVQKAVEAQMQTIEVGLAHVFSACLAARNVAGQMRASQRAASHVLGPPADNTRPRSSTHQRVAHAERERRPERAGRHGNFHDAGRA